jgi:hypothetical protein
MSEEKKAAAEKIVEKKVDYKTGDYLELEFELGDLEFEATGKSKVVENLFMILLDKIASGELPIHGIEEEEEEEEEFEKEADEEEEIEEEGEEEGEDEQPEADEEPELEPTPDWESLDTETPPESPIERELEDD